MAARPKSRDKPVQTTKPKQPKKQPKKQKKLEANYNERKRPVCPCGSEEFTEIKDYDVSPDSKRHIGIYKFVVDCVKCGSEVTYYCNL